MPGTTDEVIVKFTTEGGDVVVETFEKTADASDQFHQKITKAGGALGDLRLKSEGRIANNIGAIAQAMVGGATAGDLLAISVTKVTESFRGSLLFAGGAVIGAALYQGVTRAGEAIIKLQDDLAGLRRVGNVPGDFLGTDDINKGLDLAISRMDQLHRQGLDFSGIAKQLAFLAQFASAGNPFAAVAGKGLSSLFGKLSDADKQKEKEFQEEGIKALTQLGEKQQSLNDITREGLNGDEKQAALAKEEADHEERSYKLSSLAARVGLSQTDTEQLLAKENSFTGFRTAAIEKRFSIQQRGVELQAKVIDVEKQLLPPAEENLKILDARIAGVQDLLDHQHNLTDQEREQLLLQRGQLEVTKQRAQFARQLEKDLAGLELGRVRGAVGSDRARIESLQRVADQERAQSPNSPEFQRAEAGLEDEQFKQFQDYEKNPGAFRQRRIDEQFQRKRFQYLRGSGQLPDDIKSYSKDLDPANQKNLVPSIATLIKTLIDLPKKIGVG